MAVFKKTNFESSSVILCLIIIFLFVSIGKTALIEVNPSRQIHSTEQPYRNYIDIINIGRRLTFSEIQNAPDLKKSQDEWQESIATQRREDEQRRFERENEWLTQYSSNTSGVKKMNKDFTAAGLIVLGLVVGTGIIYFLCIVCRNRSHSRGRVYQPAVGEINPYPVQQITIGSYAGPGQTPIQPPHPYYSCYPGQPYIQIPQQQSFYPGQPQVQIPQYQPNFNLAQNSDQNTVETSQSQFPSALNETEPYGFPVDKRKSKKIPGPTD